MNHAELTWIPVVHLDPNADPELTPLQQTHRMALETARTMHATPLELDMAPSDATMALHRALRCYSKAASRPRKAACWSFVACELWNARQDAVRAGVLDRESDSYAFISDCYTDAQLRSEQGHALEIAGHADVRV